MSQSPGEAGDTFLQEKALEEGTRKLLELADWLDGLGEHDRNNVVALIKLPMAIGIIAKHPDPVYREMAGRALAVYLANEGFN